MMCAAVTLYHAKQRGNYDRPNLRIFYSCGKWVSSIALNLPILIAFCEGVKSHFTHRECLLSSSLSLYLCVYISAYTCNGHSSKTIAGVRNYKHLLVLSLKKISQFFIHSMSFQKVVSYCWMLLCECFAAKWWNPRWPSVTVCCHWWFIC